MLKFTITNLFHLLFSHQEEMIQKLEASGLGYRVKEIDTYEKMG